MQRRLTSIRTSKLTYAATALALITAATSPARAIDDTEPFNNRPPWVAGAYIPQTVFMLHAGGYGIGGFEISSPTDVDYIVLGCTQGDPAAVVPYVDNVRI